MKIVAYSGAVFLSLIVMGAGIVALVFTGTHHDPLLLLLGTLPLTALIYGPLLLGSLVTFWDTTRSAESRAFYRRWAIRVIVTQAVGAVAIVLDVILGGTAWWVAAAFIVGGVVLTMLALAVGNAVRRYDARRSAGGDEHWQPVTREEVDRKVRAVIITFVVGLIAAVIVFTVLELTSPHPQRELGLVPILLEFPLFAAALACIVVAMPIGRQLRETAAGDLGLMRTFARVVLKGKSDPLRPDAERGAARYAAGINLFMRFQLAYLGLLYAGILLQQLTSLLTGSVGNVLPIVVGGGLIVLFAVLLPIQLHRLRRARDYADVHRHLLITGA